LRDKKIYLRSLKSSKGLSGFFNISARYARNLFYFFSLQTFFTLSRNRFIEPPKFTVTNLIAEGDFVTALGDITLKDEDGKAVHHSYCDVWRFRGGKIVELRAFVIKT